MSASELTERLLARRSAATMDQLIDRNVESNWDSIAAASTRLERLVADGVCHSIVDRIQDATNEF